MSNSKSAVAAVAGAAIVGVSALVANLIARSIEKRKLRREVNNLKQEVLNLKKEVSELRWYSIIYVRVQVADKNLFYLKNVVPIDKPYHIQNHTSCRHYPIVVLLHWSS